MAKRTNSSSEPCSHNANVLSFIKNKIFIAMQLHHLHMHMKHNLKGNTWCGYQVPRMILLHTLKGTHATWL